MSTLHESRSARTSLTTLAFGLALGVGSGALLGACSEASETETCFEVLPFEEEEVDGEVPVCGTTLSERASLTNGVYSELYYHCIPLNECPNECPAQDVIDNHIIPGYAEEDPDYTVGEVIPLCMKNDIAAGNCCYISLLLEG